MRAAMGPPTGPSSRQGQPGRRPLRRRPVRGDPRRARRRMRRGTSRARAWRRVSRAVFLLRAAAVLHLEPFGGCEQQRRRITTAVYGEADLGLQTFAARASKLVEWTGL